METTSPPTFATTQMPTEMPTEIPTSEEGLSNSVTATVPNVTPEMVIKLVHAWCYEQLASMNHYQCITVLMLLLQFTEERQMVFKETTASVVNKYCSSAECSYNRVKNITR